MHEIDARARGQQRQQGLLAEHPLHAVAGMDRNGDGCQQLPPGAVPRGSGLAVDERGEPHPRRGGEQRRDQLARVHLHSARLAGYEEDQVQADVWLARGHCRARLCHH